VRRPILYGRCLFGSRGICHSLIDQLQSIHYNQDCRPQTADSTKLDGSCHHRRRYALVSDLHSPKHASSVMLPSSSLRPKNLTSKKASKISHSLSVGQRSDLGLVYDLGSSQVEANIKTLLETVGIVGHIMFTAGRQTTCHLSRAPHRREHASSGPGAYGVFYEGAYGMAKELTIDLESIRVQRCGAGGRRNTTLATLLGCRRSSWRP
jgi:hypothetical protein